MKFATLITILLAINERFFPCMALLWCFYCAKCPEYSESTLERFFIGRSVIRTITHIQNHSKNNRGSRRRKGRDVSEWERCSCRKLRLGKRPLPVFLTRTRRFSETYSETPPTDITECEETHKLFGSC